MEHNAIICVLESFHSDNFIASRDLLINQRVAMITRIIRRSSHLVDLFLVLGLVVSDTRLSLVLPGTEASKCLVAHAWVHQNAHGLAIRRDVEDLVMDRLAAVIARVSHHAHYVVRLEAKINLVDPS